MRERFIFPLLMAALSLGCATSRAADPALGATSAKEDWVGEIVRTGDWVGSDRGPMDPLIPSFDPLHSIGPADQIKAQFRGTDRRLAKTSIASAALEPETTVDRLAGSLIADDTMLAHDPPITEAPTSDRVEEEKRSVAVRGWIYAIKYEDDQDWHLIVGTSPSGQSRTYLTCEVSGLPATNAASYRPLERARESLARILHDVLPGPGSYTSYVAHPIPVRIEGSLFFDIDHPAGAVGPTGMHPKTAWEIHPVTRIELKAS